MVSREEIQGHWNEVTGRLKKQWGQLTDNDLQQAEGSAEQLVGVVQQKTGASRREVESFIDSLFSDNMSDRAKETVHQYADAAQQAATDAGEYARQQAEWLAEQSGDYSAKLAKTIRSRPTESLAIAFAVGIAAGIFLFSSRRR